MSGFPVRVGGRTIEISHPNKELFPGDGVTKLVLADYYRKVAPRMLPFLRDRPVSLQRFPDGIKAEGFYEKKVPEYFPDWVDRVRVKVKEGGSQEQVMCNSAATLVYLADLACITPHPWLSRKDRLDCPDRMIFDLDPSGNEFGAVKHAALTLRSVLEASGLSAFVMATGSRGLHVVVPLSRKQDFDEVREAARSVAEEAARNEPDALTTEPRKRARKGRVFVDYLRNAYGQTAVPPYAVRARKGAPVAVPLSWDELSSGRLGPASFNVKNLFARLSRISDPWRDFSRHARSL